MNIFRAINSHAHSLIPHENSAKARPKQIGGDLVGDSVFGRLYFRVFNPRFLARASVVVGASSGMGLFLIVFHSSSPIVTILTFQM